MTTTHDANPTESASTYYDADPTESVGACTTEGTPTIAEAWASGPIDEPEGQETYGFTAPAELATQPGAASQPVAGHAFVLGALAFGISAGAALGLMFFDATPAHPTVVVPGVGTSPHQATVVSPTSQAPASKPVVPVQETPQATVAPAPAQRLETSAAAPPPVGAPQVGNEGDTTVVVDIPIPDFPPLPEKPEEPDPEPPQPPDIPDLDFKAPEPPPEPPDPDPPVFVPDLPLAPALQPDPIIEIPPGPRTQLNPELDAPSLPKFDSELVLGS